MGPAETSCRTVTATSTNAIITLLNIVLCVVACELLNWYWLNSVMVLYVFWNEPDLNESAIYRYR